ncbi:MAG: PAS domain S-box protein, partial [Methanomicrobiales archaeon]|nr:PAS domain S-box protein [Methanomicrobiales archaeon]
MPPNHTPTIHSRKSKKDLEAEIADLRAQLQEAMETLQAIRTGQVDAVVVEGTDGQQVFTLQGADYPYRILIQEMNDAAIILSEDRTILFCNQYFSGLVRAPLKKMIGFPIDSYIFSEDRERFNTLLENPDAIANKGEIRFQAVDGPVYPMMLSLIQTGDLGSICVVATDLSAQKRIEEHLRTEYEESQKALQVQERREHLVMDTVPALIAYIDSDFRYRSVNKGYESWFGRPAQDIEGRHIREVLGEAVWREIRPELEGAMAGRVVKYEKMMPYQHGEPRWVQVTCVPDKDEEGRIRGIVAHVMDIGERKRAEEELHDLMARYELILAGSHAAIWDWDVIRNMVMYSSQWKALRGYEDHEVSNREEEWSNGIHPDDAPKVFAAVQEHFEGKTPVFAMEYRVRCKDGSWKWIFDRGLIYRDAAGKVVRMAGSEEDITDRKQKEEAQKKLEESLQWRKQREELLAGVAGRLLNTENPQDIINDLCLETMSFLNCDVFFNYLEVPKENRLHLNAFAGIPDKEAKRMEWLENGLAVCECAARDGCSIVVENIPVTPDPRTDLVKSYGVLAYACHPLIIEGDVIGTISFGTRSRKTFTDEELAVMKSVADSIAVAMHRLMINIDLQQTNENLLQSERELRQTQQYLENLITYANAPIVVWDPQFRITHFNRAFERLTGREAKEVIGKEINILFPEKYLKQSMDLIKKTAAGEKWETVEIPILHRDGGIKIVLWNSATLYKEDGKTVLSTIAQGQDITDRKKAQDTLQQYIENLKKSNEDLERFAYIASHDLQEPLRNVVSFSQLLSRRYQGRLNTDADEYIGYIVEGGKRMQALVQDLLEYSRVSTRGQTFEPVSCDTIVDRVIRNLQVTIQESDAVIKVNALPIIFADSTQL